MTFYFVIHFLVLYRDGIFVPIKGVAMLSSKFEKTNSYFSDASKNGLKRGSC